MSDDSGDGQTTEGGSADRSGAGGENRADGTGDGETGVCDLLAALDGDGTVQSAVEEGPADPATVAVEERLADRVAEAPADTVARALAALGETVTALDSEVTQARERADDLESRLRRKQADFQNYKKRQKQRMEEERERATEDLVERLLEVRDNLQRALETDEDADIRGGVESTLAQFDRELDRENVDSIEPDPGEAVDPVRHEVLATVPAQQPADRIAQLHRPGYEMAGKVLRPAQVTVSQGDDSTDSTEDESDDPSATDGDEA